MSDIDHSFLKKLLLPHVFQKVGYILSAAGAAMTYLRFGAGYKPEFLEIQVFAVYSKYFDSKYFQVIQNNISEEICGIVLLVGLFFAAFSREKTEKDELWVLRLKSLLLSIYGSIAFLLVTFFFFYGLAFVSVLSLYIILPLVLYILLFRYQVYRNNKMSQI